MGASVGSRARSGAYQCSYICPFAGRETHCQVYGPVWTTFYSVIGPPYLYGTHDKCPASCHPFFLHSRSDYRGRIRIKTQIGSQENNRVQASFCFATSTATGLSHRNFDAPSCLICVDVWLQIYACLVYVFCGMFCVFHHLLHAPCMQRHLMVEFYGV